MWHEDEIEGTGKHIENVVKDKVGEFGLSGESMTTRYETDEALKMRDQVKAKEVDWQPHTVDENPENLPWPEENESKE